MSPRKHISVTGPTSATTFQAGSKHDNTYVQVRSACIWIELDPGAAFSYKAHKRAPTHRAFATRITVRSHQNDVNDLDFLLRRHGLAVGFDTRAVGSVRATGLIVSVDGAAHCHPSIERKPGL